MADRLDTNHLTLLPQEVDANGQEMFRRLGADRIIASRERALIFQELLSENQFFPLWDKQILEIECGSGEMLQTMLDFGAAEENLFGVDLIPRRIDAARRRFPNAHLFCEYAEDLNFHDSRFDLIICSSVFSYISDAGTAAKLVGEIRRILQPGGAVVWYDLRYMNPGNRDVRSIGKRTLRRLFGSCDFALQSCTLLPPLSRALGPKEAAFYPLLASVPFLRSHYAGLIIPRPTICRRAR